MPRQDDATNFTAQFNAEDTTGKLQLYNPINEEYKLITSDDELSEVAFSGDYNDLANKPDIPAAAPVQSVNGRTGNVTGLAEQSDLAAEATARENADTTLSNGIAAINAVLPSKLNVTDAIVDKQIAYADSNWNAGKTVYTDVSLIGKTVRVWDYVNGRYFLPSEVSGFDSAGQLTFATAVPPGFSGFIQGAIGNTLNFVTKEEFGKREYRFLSDAETFTLVSRNASNGSVNVSAQFTQSNVSQPFGRGFEMTNTTQYYHQVYAAASPVIADGKTIISVEGLERVNQASDEYGLAIGSSDLAQPTSFYHYRSNGAVIKAFFNNAAAVVTAYRTSAAGAAFSYGDTDIVKVEIEYHRDKIVLNTYKNGVLNGSFNDTVFPPSGSVFTSFTGNNAFFTRLYTEEAQRSTDIKVNDVYSILDAKYTAKTDFIQSLVAKVFNFSTLVQADYTISTLPTVTSVVIGSSDTQLTVQLNSNTSGVAALLNATLNAFCNLAIDGQRLEMQYTPNGVPPASSSVGFGFGVNGLVSGNGSYILYHNNGALISFDGGSYNTVRTANSTSSYTSGDTISLIATIYPSQNKAVFQTKKNGTPYPDEIELTVSSFANFILAFRAQAVGALNLIAYSDTGGGGSAAEGTDTGYNKVDIIDGDISQYDSEGRYVTIPAGRQGAGIESFSGAALTKTIYLDNAKVSDMYFLQSLNAIEALGATPFAGGVTFSRNSGGVNNLKFCWRRLTS